AARNRIQDFAFGVLRRCRLAKAHGCRIRLVGGGQQAEDLSGPCYPDDKHAGGHRIERARVPHLASAEDAPAAADDVVARDALRFIDDHQSGVGHSTMAVRARPSRTDQRPDSVSSGGPDSAAGSIRMRDSNVPAVPLSSTSKVM